MCSMLQAYDVCVLASVSFLLYRNTPWPIGVYVRDCVVFKGKPCCKVYGNVVRVEKSSRGILQA